LHHTLLERFSAHTAKMPTVQTPRMRIASEKYAKNINKRGQVSTKTTKTEEVCEITLDRCLFSLHHDIQRV
jgi:hypothetical protein